MSEKLAAIPGGGEDALGADLDAAREAQRKYATEETGPPSRQTLKLPDIPDDPGERLRWLTDVFELDPNRPFTAAKWLGPRGPGGRVLLERLGAPPIRFEPAKSINTPLKLIEQLTWQRVPSDDKVPGLKGEHCRLIAHVVSGLCDNSAHADAADEARVILNAYLADAEAVDGPTTRGTSPQRFEAACALRRGHDDLARPGKAPKFLVDRGADGEEESELVVRVSDLGAVARRLVGSKPWSWLDGLMAEIGWERVRLDGREYPGRTNRGQHARCDVYRGRLEPAERETT